jgi:hypothetical protein
MCTWILLFNVLIIWFNIIKHVLPSSIEFFVRIHGDAHTKEQQLEENEKCKKWVATSERGR